MNSENKKEKKPFNKRKLKFGAAATVVTIFVIAAIVFVNLIAGILTEKKGFKLDLTSQKYFDVSQDTIDYIRNIDKDVEIAVMSEKDKLEGNTYYKMVIETLAKYEQNSDHINVNYYSITKNPEVINKYSAYYNGTINEGNIIVACGDRVKVTSVDSLFNIDTQAYYSTGNLSYSGYKGEQEITSLVMNVTDSHPVKAAILAAYNGQSIYTPELTYDVNSFAQLLSKNGYEYEVVDILTDELSPDTYDMVVLPAPLNDLTDDCIAKLESFLYNGGKLDKDMIYIADIYQRATPKIDQFLEVWGIKVAGNMVMESAAEKNLQVNVVRNTSGAYQSLKVPAASIADEKYEEGLSNTKLPIAAAAVRNIELLFDSNVDRDTSAILKTSDTSIRYPLNLKTASEEGADLSAQINGEEEQAEKAEEADSEEAAEAATEATEAATEATEAETEAFDPETADKQESIIMAMATKSNMDGDTEHKNNLLVIGGMSMTDPYITGVSTYNNAEFVVNTINKMTGKENAVIIAEKNFESTALDVTEGQVSVLQKVVVFGLPLIVVICGIVVFVRRKNK